MKGNPADSEKIRFLWLDAARGFAALAGMLYHFRDYLGVEDVFRFGYVAVDLFFMMSGFVLAHAYGDKLQQGMSIGRFLLVRLVRLYPGYVLSLLIGAAYYAAKIALRTDDAPPLADMGAIMAQNLFFIPNSIDGVTPAGTFPFSPASWSLAMEMIASIAFGMVIWHLRQKVLVLLALLAGMIFFMFALRFGSIDIGFDLPHFGAGLFRCMFEFTVGVLLYRGAARWRARSVWLTPLLMLCAVVPMFVLAPSPWASAVLVVVVFPLFIILQPQREPQGAIALACVELGRISYPLYLLHTPLFLWAAGVHKMLLGTDPATVVPWFGVGLSLFVIGFSWLSARFFDEPVRKLLRAWIGRQSAVQARWSYG
ncbi:peptidoglycan/LPS O-acetylase OafA/YrhL [Altererythrobacter atlanticus]|uniref:Acyltransferase family protein n=1 Tax=Croceibacterium atlanticum TaxID=1267766 RepID=A0A0F7KP03_9SPHN|nr:acyltransferase [Croceibacterium atlanticum]AKH41309.1 Acyltransferase family protein [Croceibacterium atlanticum]MBB5732827.1 peptidoglycan/LPS O-acetylase OafA/YrhL [Croceibacterium atlanticum]